MSRQNTGNSLQVLIVKSSPDVIDYNQLLSCDRQFYQIQEWEITSEVLEIDRDLKPDCILLNWASPTSEKFLEYIDKNLIPVVILVESKNQTLGQHYLVKETLTKELLCYAIDRAIALPSSPKK